MTIRLPNSVFVHVPRTGGFWLAEVLHYLEIPHQRFKGDIDSHFTYKELPEHWRKLRGFGFVRHPLRWVVSRWSHLWEHELVNDHRHFGVHRLFDECVRTTLEDTIKEIMEAHPGLVGRTYREMLTGVDYLCRTEDLPNVVCKLLHALEDVPESKFEVIIRRKPVNCTSGLSRWKQESADLSEKLAAEFVESEKDAVDIWTNGITEHNSQDYLLRSEVLRV